MEYRGFTIVDCGWGYRVYHSAKYGYVRSFDTIAEAQEFIDENF